MTVTEVSEQEFRMFEQASALMNQLSEAENTLDRDEMGKLFWSQNLRSRMGPIMAHFLDREDAHPSVAWLHRFQIRMLERYPMELVASIDLRQPHAMELMKAGLHRDVVLAAIESGDPATHIKARIAQAETTIMETQEIAPPPSVLSATIVQSTLKTALGHVKRTVPGRSTLDVLKYVLLHEENGFLWVTSTNLETATQIPMPGSVDPGFRILVPFKEFDSTVKSLPKQPVTLTINGDVLMINGSRTLKGMDADEYPTIPRHTHSDRSLHLPVQLLKQFADGVAIAASDDEVRPALNAVHLYIDQYVVRAESSDGFRAHRITVPNSWAFPPQKILIPAKTFVTAMKLPSKLSPFVWFHVSPDGSQLTMDFNEGVFATRIIDAKFPDLAYIIPTATLAPLIVERTALLDNVLGSATIAKQRANIIELETSAAGVRIHTRYQGFGSYDETTPLRAGDTVGKIALNQMFLVDALKALGSHEVSIHFPKKDGPPIVLRTVGSEDRLMMIMPMTLKEGV